MFPIKRTYLTEINLGSNPSVGQQIYFGDYAAVRGAIIYGIMAGDNTILSKSPSNNTVVGLLTGLTLTLVQDPSLQRIYNYPVYDLNPANAGGFYRTFEPFPLNLVKSYITITDATSLNANESVLFNILYALPGDLQKQPSQKPRVK